MKPLLLSSLWLLLISVGYAQVEYDVEPIVDSVVTNHVNVWKKAGKVDMYCIQVSSLSGQGSSVRAKEMVNELNAVLAKEKIKAKAYSTFVQPNHKVRIGYFATKIEAYHVLKLLPARFSGAFITTDQMKIGANN